MNERFFFTTTPRPDGLVLVRMYSRDPFPWFQASQLVEPGGERAAFGGMVGRVLAYEARK